MINIDLSLIDDEELHQIKCDQSMLMMCQRGDLDSFGICISRMHSSNSNLKLSRFNICSGTRRNYVK